MKNLLLILFLSLKTFALGNVVASEEGNTIQEPQFPRSVSTPVQAYDSSGEKVWECALDIYGKTMTVEGEASFVPFRFQGQYEDVETGLYYNRFRYYSVDTGTYISQDPIGLASGEYNLYTYVNNSNYLVDPLGLSGMPSSGWNYGNMPKIDGYQNHHVIPKSMANHPAIQSAGFDVNKPSNLIYLPKEEGTHPTRSRHKGWNRQHKAYNADMLDKLNKIDQKGMAQGWNQAKYKAEIDKLRGDTRQGLRKGKIKCH